MKPSLYSFRIIVISIILGLSLGVIATLADSGKEGESQGVTNTTPPRNIDRTYDLGFRATPGGAERLDLTSIYGECRKVTSSGSEYESFISTRTLSGWTSFKTNRPSYLDLEQCEPGEWVYTLGRLFRDGTGGNEFAFIHGAQVTRDPNGNIYFVRADGGIQIKKYSSTGAWLFTLGRSNSDANTQVNSAATENNLSGTAAVFPGLWYGRKIPLAVDSSENIYVAINGSKIKKYSAIGGYLWTLGSDTYGDNTLSGPSAQFTRIAGLNITPSGRIIVQDQGGRKIKIYDSNGNYLQSIGSSYFDNNLSGEEAGMGLVAGNGSSAENDSFILTNSGNIQVFAPMSSVTGKFKRYTATGSWLADYVPPVASGVDISTLSSKTLTNGEVYMYTQSSKDQMFQAFQVFRFSSTGSLLMTLGGNPSATDEVFSGGVDALVSNNVLITGSGDIVMTSQAFTGLIKVYSNTGSLKYTIGSTTVGGDNNLSGQYARLTFPKLLATDPADNSIYVVDQICDPLSEAGNPTCKIKKYSSTGSHLMTLGSGIFGDNNLSRQLARFGSPYIVDWYGNVDPNGFNLDAQGNIVFYDDFYNKVRKYTSTGSWVMNINSVSDSGIPSDPRILALDGSGSVYVYGMRSNEWSYDYVYCSLRKYSSTGVLLLTLGGPTCGNNTLSQVSALLRPLESNPYNGGRKVYIDNTNNIYIKTTFEWPNEQTQFFKKYSSTGVYLFQLGNGVIPSDNNLSGQSAGFSVLPARLKFDNNNNIYYYDQSNNKVKIYSSTGSWLRTIGKTWETNSLGGTGAVLFGSIYDSYYGDRANDVLSNAADELVVVTGNNSVHKYSSTGALIAAIGKTDLISAGTGENDLSGPSASINSTVIGSDYANPYMDDDGDIYITYPRFHKVKKYSSTGDWLFNIGSGIQGDNTLSQDSAELNLELTTYWSNAFNATPVTSDDGGATISLFDAANNKIKKYSGEGDFLAEYLVDPTNIGPQNTWGFEEAAKSFIYGGGTQLLGRSTDDLYGVSWWARLHLYSITGANLGYIGSSTPPRVNGLGGREAFLSNPSGTVWYSGGNPQGPILDSYGNLWLQYPEVVVQYSITGGYLRSFTGMTHSDKDGNGYSYNSESSSLKKYSRTGALLFSLEIDRDPLSLSSIQDDGLGRFLLGYGVNGGNYYFELYSSTGMLLTTIGSYTQGNTTQNGTSAQFQSVTDIKFYNGQILFLDIGTCRVKKYDYKGIFKSVIGSDCNTNNTLSGPNAGFGQFGDYRSMQDILLDNSGSVYLARDTELKKYSSTGAYLYSLPKAYNQDPIHTFKILSNNSPIVVNGSEAYIYSAVGDTVEYTFSGVNNAYVNVNSVKAFDIDKRDFIYLLEADNVIRKYSSTGALLLEIGSGLIEDNDLNGTGAGFGGTPRMIKSDGAEYIYVITDEIIKRYSTYHGDVWALPQPPPPPPPPPGPCFEDCEPNPCITDCEPAWSDAFYGMYSLEIGKDWTKIQGNREDVNITGNSIGTKLDKAGRVFNVISGRKINVYSPDGDYIFTLGSDNTGDNNLSGTQALFRSISSIGFDSANNIYIVDSRSYKVKKYSSAGVWINTIGSTRGDSDLGGTNTQFYYPQFVTVHADDSISVVDSFSWADYMSESRSLIKVKRYSPTGAYLGQFGSLNDHDNTLSGPDAKLKMPWSVMLDDEQNIVVNDLMNNKFKIYSSTGGFLSEIDKGTKLYLDDQRNMASRATPNLPQLRGGYLVDADCSGRCLRIYQSGSLLAQIGNGDELLTRKFDYYEIQTATGVNKLSGTQAVLATPFMFEVSKSGDGIYIGGGATDSTEGYQCMIKKYSLTGEYLFTLGGPGAFDENTWSYTCPSGQLSGEDAGFKVKSFTTDNSGNLYVLSQTGSYWNGGLYTQIKKYDAMGNWILDIGGAPGDNDLSGTDAQITSEANIYYKNSARLQTDNEGNVYVFTDRLKKYSPTGDWLLTLGDGTSNGNGLSGRSAGLSYAVGNIYGGLSYQIDGSGSIYVHNSYYYYRKYDENGNFLYSVGSNGGGPGDNTLSLNSALMSHSMMTDVDTSGRVYIADFGSNNVKVYNSDGTWALTIGNDYTYMYSNELSGTQALIFGKYSNNGQWSDYSGLPYGYITTPTGNLAFQFCGQLFQYSQTGGLDLVLGTKYNVVIDRRYGTYCNYESFASNDLSGPSAQIRGLGAWWNSIQTDYVGTTPSGNYLILSENTLKVYSPTGDFLYNVGGNVDDNELSGTDAGFSDGSSYKRIASGPNNEAYIFDTGHKKIKGYDSSGNWLLSLGQPGQVENNLSGNQAVWQLSNSMNTSSYGFYVDGLSGSIYFGTLNPYAGYKFRYKKYSSNGDWLYNLGAYVMENNSSGEQALIPVTPSDMLEDYSGSVWIASIPTGYDFDYNIVRFPKIKKYSSTGGYLFTLGSGIAEDNQLSGSDAGFMNPDALNVDASNNLYVFDLIGSDVGEGKIKKYTADGDWISEIYLNTNCWYDGWYYSGPGKRNWTLNQSGALLVNNCDTNFVEQYSPTGQLQFSIADIGKVYTDEQNNIYVYSSYILKKYSSTGAFLMTLGQGVYGENNLSWGNALFTGIYKVQVDVKGNIYISTYSEELDADVIKKYSPKGTYLMTLGGGLYNGPQDLSGTAATIYPSEFYVDTYGHIITQYNNDLIKTYTSTGQFLAILGSGSSDGNNGIYYDNKLSGSGAEFYIQSYPMLQFVLSAKGDAILIFDNALKVKRYVPNSVGEAIDGGGGGMCVSGEDPVYGYPSCSKGAACQDREPQPEDCVLFANQCELYAANFTTDIQGYCLGTF